MLIWDTGEYSVLPLRKSSHHLETDESEGPEEDGSNNPLSECEKLVHAFQQRKIRLRLHGSRLPKGYTVYIRLTKENNRSDQPKKPARRRRRPDQKQRPKQVETSSDSEATSSTLGETEKGHLASLARTESPPKKIESKDDGNAIAVASDDESETIRVNNAYMGATNDVGSIHQRRWYLSLDRENSGFVLQSATKHSRRWWIRRRDDNGGLQGFERFVVTGRDGERSVVTGRLASDILRDEGVEGYTPRGLWRPVTE